MGILWEEAILSFLASLHNKDQLLKERICSCRSKFFPSRVDPISKSYLTYKSKQKFKQVNKTFFLEKRQGAFITAGVFIRINP